MMWLTEKKIFHHYVDLGYEGVAIPVRVKFEFEVSDGQFVQDSLKYEPLYNKDALLSRYPNLDAESLDIDIVKTVERGIRLYMESNGYIKSASDSDKLSNTS